VFPEASLLNHDCSPNCTYLPLKCADGTFVITILAVMTVQPVKSGDELTICYDELLPKGNKWGIHVH